VGQLCADHPFPPLSLRHSLIVLWTSGFPGFGVSQIYSVFGPSYYCAGFAVSNPRIMDFFVLPLSPWRADYLFRVVSSSLSRFSSLRDVECFLRASLPLLCTPGISCSSLLAFFIGHLFPSFIRDFLTLGERALQMLRTPSLSPPFCCGVSRLPPSLRKSRFLCPKN